MHHLNPRDFSTHIEDDILVLEIRGKHCWKAYTDFIARVQTIMDSDPSKPLRSIARDLIYLEIMKNKVLHWIKKVAGNRPWVWQQDYALCHTSRRTTVMTW